MSFILIILIVLGFIFWPLIRTIWTINRATRQARRMFTGGSTGSGGSPRQRQYTRPVRKKIFSRDDGEYVDYEEIAVTSDTTVTDNGRSVRYETEQQIVDVEWEEIR
ncbi:MAG: DUF4834 family protein [Pseudoflavonifractor sp.]|nr:DUF4834 family protein [Pseudoflavonifractor sp.]